MRRETFTFSLLALFRSSTAAGIDDVDILRTIRVASDPSMILNEFDLLDHNDRELEDALVYGESNIVGIDDPYHFLPLDDQDSPILDTSTTRKLSATSAKIGTFSPLDCNPTSWSSCDTIDASDLPSNGNPFVVPCGECNRFEITGNVTLNGLNIKGKLLFPVNHKVNIFTPFVIVQGELEINVDHSKVSPDNLATRFTLTGTDDVKFTPTDQPNANACDSFSNGCNIGVKPFLVAGGKVNINSIPDTCTTHTSIKKKIYKDPVYDPANFTQFVTLPPSCPQSGISFVSYDFEDQNIGNWTGRWGTFVEPVGGALKFTNRKLTSRGPEIDLTPTNPELCLVPDQIYVFVSRLKLDMADGSMHGEDTTCAISNKMCPEFHLRYHDGETSEGITKFYLHKHIGPKYGEYVDFYGTVTFSAEQLPSDMAYFTLGIRGPEPDVDITIENFDLFLPTEASYQDPSALCQELVVNGDAESNGFSPYPMSTYRADERLRVLEENGNKFFRLSDRYYDHSSLRYDIDTNCLTRGVTYIMSAKVRYNHVDGNLTASDSYYWYILFTEASGGSSLRTILTCPAQSAGDGWVTCSGEFMVDAALAEGTALRLSTRSKDSTNGKNFDFDYDDISISYHKGYVSELVVDKGDTSCWGDGADVHVTTSTYYSSSSLKTNGYLSQIETVVDNGDGSVNIQMNVASTLPIISEEENPDYAAEIALVTRNVIIEGEEGEDRKGGYMQVLHTPNVPQSVKGVEFRNMGRRSEVDRYAFQFLYSGDVEGTQIAGNSFRESNQRCVSVEGTSNVTISQNIGYRPRGDCFHIGYQSESNLITRNLVSDNIAGGSVSGEADNVPSAFRNRYSPNEYTYNIAVGGVRHGFVLSNNYRTRLEDGSWSGTNVRRIQIGTFHGNVAKSNANTGIYLDHQESNKETVISNAKMIKNWYQGLYLTVAHNLTIVDSLFADNTRYGFNSRIMENIRIQNTVFLGVTPETKALVKPPYFDEPCTNTNTYAPPVGLNMPTNIYWWLHNGNKLGITLTDVVFSDFDHSDKCASSIPITFRTAEQFNNHFDYLTMFKNVTLEGPKKMDASSSAERNVTDIVIHDIDGSSDPSGQASHGMFVSNVNYLKKFSNHACTDHPHGICYCANSCYRTVSFMVEQDSTAEFEVRIRRTTDGETALVPFTYKYDYDEHKKDYYSQFRYFPVSLPEGSYEIEFLKNSQLQWPTFVLPRWEGVPACEGYVSAANITVIEPEPLSCDELIINGDIEQGRYLWQHRNNVDTSRGTLTVDESGGVNNSTALRISNRYRSYTGVGQSLDTRCLRRSLNEFYEIELYFRLEEDTVPFTCDPHMSDSTKCPYVSFKQQKYDDETLITVYSGGKAKVVIPNDIGMSLVHGVVKIDENLASLERLFMYLENADQKYDMIIDNVSVKKLPGICGGDLIRNGDFEENSKFWGFLGTVKFDIETFSTKALKVFDKSSSDDGARQYLYIDSSCFSEKQRYMITAKSKIENPSTGATPECDRTTWDGDLECSNIRLDYSSPLGNGNTVYTETAATASNLFQGWNLMSGIMTVTEKQAAHSSIYVRLYGSNKNMNVYYDDVSIVPIPQSCDNLILNSDIEVGDSRFWLPSDRRYIDVDIFSPGADGSQYSLMVKKYTSNRLRQSLDTRCLLEGQQFDITAKFRYLDEDDLTTGVACDPSLVNYEREGHCPSIIVRGSDCVGGNVEKVLWNQIYPMNWDPDTFNNFAHAFRVESDIASCETVMLEVGHRVHAGRVLLIDDINVVEKITTSPSVSPTGPTAKPTVATESPSAPRPEVQYVGNPCGNFFSDGKCEICTGDCDNDSDCVGDSRCFQRNGGEDVPGCVWGADSDSLKASNNDFCMSTDGFPQIRYAGNPCTDHFLDGKCTLCTGDCDRDSDCAGDLICYQRNSGNSVPGCVWGPDNGDLVNDSSDYCILPP